MRVGYLAQGVTTGITAAALIAGASPAVVYALATVAAVTYTLGRPNHHALMPSLGDTPGGGRRRQLRVVAHRGDRRARSAGSSAAVLAGVGAGRDLRRRGGRVARRGPADPRRAHAPRRTRTPTGRSGRGAWRPTRSSGLARIGAIAEPAPARADRGARRPIATGAIGVLTVPLAIDRLGLGDSGVGLLTTMISVGLLLGAGISVAFATRRALVWPMAIGRGGASRSAARCSGARDARPWPRSPSIVYGAAITLLDVLGRTMLQRTTTDDVLTRVFGAVEAMWLLGYAGGAAVAPALQSRGRVCRGRSRSPAPWCSMRRGRLDRRVSGAIDAAVGPAGAPARAAAEHPDVRAAAAARPRAARPPARPDRDAGRHRGDPAGRRRRPVLRDRRGLVRVLRRRRAGRHRWTRARSSARSRCCTTCRGRRPCAPSATARSGRWTRRSSWRPSPDCRRARPAAHAISAERLRSPALTLGERERVAVACDGARDGEVARRRAPTRSSAARANSARRVASFAGGVHVGGAHPLRMRGVQRRDHRVARPQQRVADHDGEVPRRVPRRRRSRARPWRRRGPRRSGRAGRPRAARAGRRARARRRRRGARPPRPRPRSRPHAGGSRGARRGTPGPASGRASPRRDRRARG